MPDERQGGLPGLRAAGAPQGGVGILGAGYHVPETRLTNADLERRLETNDEWIRTRTGIRERRVAAEGEATSDLALPAARRALERAGLDGADLDLIVVATVTPDHAFPSTACLLQDRLGASHAAAFDISAACTGFLYGLSAAEAMIRAGTARHALVVGAEVLTRILDWQDRSTAVLLGDGAGAVVLGPAAPGFGILSTVLGADGAGAPLVRMPAGGSRLPASPETVAGRMHTFQQHGREVYRFAIQIMGDAAEEALERARLRPEDVALLVPHQANFRIIEAAARRFSFPLDRVWVNIDRYGNTSSASIPIGLAEAAEGGRLHRGDVVLVVAFGAGLTWGAATMRWL